MVGSDHDRGVAVLLGEIHGYLNGSIKVQHFVDGSGEVVGVGSMVDPAAFDHDGKAVIVLGQNIQRLPGHLGQAGHRFVTVRGVGHVGAVE
ncbi:hypothetical protein D3C75_877540 [compost metagenome]